MKSPPLEMSINFSLAGADVGGEKASDKCPAPPIGPPMEVCRTQFRRPGGDALNHRYSVQLRVVLPLCRPAPPSSLPPLSRGLPPPLWSCMPISSPITAYNFPSEPQLWFFFELLNVMYCVKTQGSLSGNHLDIYFKFNYFPNANNMVKWILKLQSIIELFTHLK